MLENEEFINGYFLCFEELDNVYKVLNIELNEVGFSEVIIIVLIDNL